MNLKRRPIKQLKQARTIEEFKHLCLKIMQARHQQKVKSIMVSSCNKGEGTSTIAANLSKIFVQQANGKILLIDANLRNPNIAEFFKVNPAPGLTDIIASETGFDAVIHETDVENLKVLPAGKNVSDPIEIHNSEKMTNCLKSLESDFEFIILDSAPIMPYSDSLYLSSKVDLVLLVIEAEKTRWEVAQESIKKFSNTGTSVFGTILNKKQFHIPRILYNKF